MSSFSKAYVENHEDADELGEAERHSELERGKGGDQGGSALLDDLGHTPDVDIPEDEGESIRIESIEYWHQKHGTCLNDFQTLINNAIFDYGIFSLCVLCGGQGQFYS